MVKKEGGARFVLGAVCFFVLVMTFAVGEAAGATYYVAVTGSDSNSGSSTSPFRTIQKAAYIVNPGDTVIVRDGTYTDTDGNNYIVALDRAGTSSNWITFKAENKWGAVLDGQNNSTGICWSIGVHAAYINIDDFEIKGCGSHGIITQAGNNIYIYRNKIHDIGRRQTTDLNGQTGTYIGASAHHITFDSNQIYTIGRLPQQTFSWTDYNHDHGLYLSGTSNNITVINNTFYDFKSGWPIDSDGDTITIANNTFYGTNPYVAGHIIVMNNNKASVNIVNNISDSAKDSFVYFYYSNGGVVNIKNNLAYGTANVVTYSPTIPSYTGSGNVTGRDPQFVNLTNRDFHLQSTSPAIRAGMDIGLRFDADGNPFASPPDLGPYEYVGTVAAPTPAPAPAPSVDTTPPSSPAGLTARVASSAEIDLSWTASTDNVGVAGYRVYRNGIAISAGPGTSLINTGLTPSTTYTYAVSAYDAAGNSSSLSGPVSATTLASSPSSPTCNTVGSNSFYGCYFDNIDFTNLKVTRTDPQINFNWGSGSPDPSLSPDTFSVRWQGDWSFASGTYRFTATADDGIRIWIDGIIILDKWIDQAATTYTVDRSLSAGIHRIKVEYYEKAGQAVARLNWAPVK